MKTNELLNTEVSFFKNYSDRYPKSEKLGDILQSIQDGEFKKQIQKLRSAEDTEKKKRIKSSLPAFTPSGVFRGGHNQSELIQHSGLICLDFDLQDNSNLEGFERLKEEIHRVPYVLYCGLSCSGKGYFMIIPIKYPHEHKSQCEAAIKYFSNIGLIADNACTDVSRFRYVSYDPEPYINRDAKVFDLLVDRNWAKKVIENGTAAHDPESQDLISTTIKVINCLEQAEEAGVTMSDNYHDWIQVAFAFATTLGEAGRPLYHRFSATSSKYSHSETDNVYSDAISHGRREVTVGSFFEIYRRYSAECEFAYIDIDWK